MPRLDLLNGTPADSGAGPADAVADRLRVGAVAYHDRDHRLVSRRAKGAGRSRRHRRVELCLARSGHRAAGHGDQPGGCREDDANGRAAVHRALLATRAYDGRTPAAWIGRRGASTLRAGPAPPAELPLGQAANRLVARARVQRDRAQTGRRRARPRSSGSGPSEPCRGSLRPYHWLRRSQAQDLAGRNRGARRVVPVLRQSVCRRGGQLLAGNRCGPGHRIRPRRNVARSPHAGRPGWPLTFCTQAAGRLRPEVTGS